MIELIEKLITEHGSSAILREHLLLLKSQITTLELKSKNLESDNKQLKSDFDQVKSQLLALQQENENLKGGNTSGHFCEHCGSPNLKRAGARPNPEFKEVGIKDDIYYCNACNKNSYFMQTL